ncbi:MAG: alpha/beta fold hydrolase [Candidatus Poseidoniales archaeon]|nr:alpha/beta fold hydrolase [Candidatus Poseidoniales archaeon]|tara:strand:- start:1334 stop:1909 length:576 start_codon:yes stop_codon:yes gene_type:complete
MPTLVMMHGMTGTSEMMRPFAEKILPSGWDLIVPQAEFEHPNRGYTWWRYEGGDQPGRRILSATELSDVDNSLLKLSNLLPDGQLVLGGFSQGGAMAQELLQFNLDVLGIIAIGTRVVRPMEIRQRLQEIPKSKLLWMHGEKDHRVSLDAGIEIAEIFEESGWDVTRIQHSKGHMIPIEFHFSIKEWLENL